MAKESRVFHRVIDVDNVEEEERGSSEAVVVTDVVGNEFATFIPDLKERLLREREELIGTFVEIGFTVYKERYLSLRSVGSPEINFDRSEVVSEEIDIGELVGDDIDRRITRQSAVHDASRIVQGMLADGRLDSSSPIDGTRSRSELREMVQEELEYWTKEFKDHHRTGEWKGDSD